MIDSLVPPPPIKIGIYMDKCTAAVTALGCRFGNTFLGPATGFFWTVGDDLFLITNWHVVTGRHPTSGEHISKMNGEPDNLQVDIFEHKNLNKRKTVVVALKDDDGNPRWREHRKFRSAVDVVCIPVPELAAHVFPLNGVEKIEAHRAAGMDVFVLGYPRGIGPDRLAIWKRASIASEPDVDVDGLPLSLIDTATAEGMSGAPVIQRFRGQAIDRDRVVIPHADGYQLLGVYAGRLPGQNETEVCLGRVWKDYVIDEIAANGVSGRREPRSVEPVFGSISYTDFAG